MTYRHDLGPEPQFPPDPRPAAAVGLSDDAWDDLWDTQAARCCDCPSCNHYLPEGQYKPESKCVLMAAVEAIVASHVTAALTEVAKEIEEQSAKCCPGKAHEDCSVTGSAAIVRAQLPTPP